MYLFAGCTSDNSDSIKPFFAIRDNNQYETNILSRGQSEAPFTLIYPKMELLGKYFPNKQWLTYATGTLKSAQDRNEDEVIVVFDSLDGQSQVRIVQRNKPSRLGDPSVNPQWESLTIGKISAVYSSRTGERHVFQLYCGELFVAITTIGIHYEASISFIDSMLRQHCT